jgi:hypothetical protein
MSHKIGGWAKPDPAIITDSGRRLLAGTERGAEDSDPGALTARKGLTPAQVHFGDSFARAG